MEKLGGGRQWRNPSTFFFVVPELSVPCPTPLFRLCTAACPQERHNTSGTSPFRVRHTGGGRQRAFLGGRKTCERKKKKRLVERCPSDCIPPSLQSSAKVANGSLARGSARRDSSKLSIVFGKLLPASKKKKVSGEHPATVYEHCCVCLRGCNEGNPTSARCLGRGPGSNIRLTPSFEYFSS